MNPGDRVKVTFEAEYSGRNVTDGHTFYQKGEGNLYFSTHFVDNAEIEVLAPAEPPVGTTIIEQNFVKGGKDRLMQVIYVRKSNGWVVFYSSDYVVNDSRSAEANWSAIVRDMDVAKKMGWTVTVVKPKDAEELL